jgi:hypothetical protein
VRAAMVPESGRAASSERCMRSRFVRVLPHKVVMPGSKPEAKVKTWAIAVTMLVAGLAQVGSALVSGA